MIFEVKTKHAAYRILSVFGVIVMLVSFMLFPVSAADAYGNEFVDIDDYAEYYFPEDTTEAEVYCDCVFPAAWFSTEVSGEEWTGYGGTFYGSSFTYEPAGDIQSYRIRPLGGNMQNGETVGDQIKKAHFIDLSGLPDDIGFFTKFAIHVNSAESPTYWQEPTAYAYLFFVDSSGSIVYKWYDRITPGQDGGGSTADGFYRSWYYNLSTLFSDLSIPDTAVGFVPLFTLKNLGLDPNSDFITIEFDPMRITYNLTSLQYQAQQNEKMQKTLDNIEDALAEQDKTLDELLTGGDAGEDLIAGSDKLEDAGAGMGDDLGQIQDFEDQYMGQLDDNMDEVIKGADLTWLYPALGFVQRYLNKIVAGVPSKYLIVFTLPMFFGLFMYIVGHPVRAPRPDTSGDQVTRETFTSTQILEGPNAGRVRSTRTVTTSREIGRVHKK